MRNGLPLQFRARSDLRGGCVRTYPYRFYVALDGNGINGFEGMAGVCLFLFDPSDNSYAYKVQYFDGAAAGHATTINPSRSVGFLGNAGQHLLFYDAATLDEVDRVSTLQYEVNDTTLRGSTHLVWLDDSEFITAVGDYLYRFDLNRLAKGERLGAHGLKLPHAMKLTASRRYIVYGGMDSPVTGEAKEVGIYDLHSGETRRVELPATCWHLATHPTEDLFYPVSFRVAPQEGRDWKDWAIGFSKSTPSRSMPSRRRCFDTGLSAGRPRRTSTPTSLSRTASSSSATEQARASCSSI